MTVNSYPRETLEFQGLTIKKDGVVTTTGIEVCIVAHGSRPTGWAPATVLGAEIGIMINIATPGSYNVWARITDAPEIPVINCGLVSIT